MTILAPLWGIPRGGAAASDPMIILTEHLAWSDARIMNVVAFGAITIEVRPAYLAAYSVGGGEMDNLTSA